VWIAAITTFEIEQGGEDTRGRIAENGSEPEAAASQGCAKKSSGRISGQATMRQRAIGTVKRDRQGRGAIRRLTEHRSKVKTAATPCCVVKCAVRVMDTAVGNQRRTGTVHKRDDRCRAGRRMEHR